MHFPTLLAGLAAFSTVVTAIPAEKPHVGVAILAINEQRTAPFLSMSSSVFSPTRKTTSSQS
ncbi:hypothetical protein FVER14953_13856 [Fusarium verticillioides]|nr:hypothetical protein FVER14953_13856 [Fusarium verticillioides]